MAREHRFFTHDLQDTSAFQKQMTFSDSLESSIFFQLTKVLRVKPGDKVCLLAPVFEGSENTEFLYDVTDTNKKAVVLSLTGKRVNRNELSYELDLLLCLPNSPDKLSFIVQKSVELGVKKIILVDSDYSRMNQKLREDRLLRIVTEAAEQSERAVLPQIVTGHNLTKFLETQAQLPEKKQIFAAVERMNEDSTEKDFGFLEKADLSKGAMVLVGPEGGFSDAEKELIVKVCQGFSLGKRILRMETAAIVALGLFALKD
ncbi:16S rRNA (uracil(1498)-N(3))-methyltransferase [Candidatus Peregrinibacteria bacterium]|nr:16S rRNA (uracil(1498)-N(3))-methyltransferase [Candidatus Peregrinibacteria bacterium]